MAGDRRFRVDGIIVIDAHGCVEAFTRAAERLFGYTADEGFGRNVAMLMPSPYREEHDSYLSRYMATGRAKIIGVGREVQGAARTAPRSRFTCPSVRSGRTSLEWASPRQGKCILITREPGAGGRSCSKA